MVSNQVRPCKSCEVTRKLRPLKHSGGGQGWRSGESTEYSLPPFNVPRVRFPDLDSHVG